MLLLSLVFFNPEWELDSVFLHPINKVISIEEKNGIYEHVLDVGYDFVPQNVTTAILIVTSRLFYKEVQFGNNYPIRSEFVVVFVPVFHKRELKELYDYLKMEEEKTIYWIP